eukprot:TRINITY_DN12701_c0_g1_i1.p2 TRINITY_DN12701_c0_g1~~TRINITY_DN12701_c0_g1_i1.p2  ORF type:complete len:114 (-),score=34.79 TRINITY_DN12701_c0_g1_i1:194-535(-)
MFVYDVTSEFSFNEMENFKIRLEKAKGNSPVIVLIGNKVDLADQRVISTEKGKQLANSWGATFMETSALTGQGVNQAFDDLVRKVRDATGGQRGGDHHDPLARRKKSNPCCLL